MIDTNSPSDIERIRARYELSEDEQRALTVALLGERVLNEELLPSDRFVTIELAEGSQFNNLARHVERVVFEERFGNHADTMAEEYGPYEKASRFFVSVDLTNHLPVGAQRVITNSAAGFKSLKDAAQPPFNVPEGQTEIERGMTELDKVWDIGTIAVLSEHRGLGGVSIQLFDALHKSARKHGIEHFVSMIDDRLKRELDLLSPAFQPLIEGAQSGSYLGSDTTHPLYARVADIYPKMIEQRARLVDDPRARFTDAIFAQLIDDDQARVIFLQP